jgi:hypothetical protein
MGKSWERVVFDVWSVKCAETFAGALAVSSMFELNTSSIVAKTGDVVNVAEWLRTIVRIWTELLD